MKAQNSSAPQAQTSTAPAPAPTLHRQYGPDRIVHRGRPSSARRTQQRDRALLGAIIEQRPELGVRAAEQSRVILPPRLPSASEYPHALGPDGEKSRVTWRIDRKRAGTMHNLLTDNRDRHMMIYLHPDQYILGGSYLGFPQGGVDLSSIDGSGAAVMDPTHASWERVGFIRVYHNPDGSSRLIMLIHRDSHVPRPDATGMIRLVTNDYVRDATHKNEEWARSQLARS